MRLPDEPQDRMLANLVAHMTSLAGSRQKKSRRMIWELRVSQCSVIGTCCTVADLERLARKFDIVRTGAAYSDYELHTIFVRETGKDSALSRAVQKLLDERFSGLIRRVERLGDPALYRTLWRDAVRSGNAPGAYWALLTSPSLPDDLMVEIFGEVHMLSHLCGASRREDIRELNATLATQQDEISHLRSDRDRILSSLQAHQATVSELKARNSFLQQKVVQLERIAQAPTSAEAALAIPPPSAADKLMAAMARLEDENASLRRALQSIRPKGSCEPAGESSQRPCQLGGRRVLYVGGVRNAICKIREVAERCGGCFLHHDGGLEQSFFELDGLACRADVVFIPVRHVSHQAALRTKALCASRGIPFCTLRSSSVSAFEEALAGVDVTPSIIQPDCAGGDSR